MRSQDDFPAPVPDHSDLRCAVAAERGMAYLDACASVSPQGAAWAAYDWLQCNEAGLPYVPMIEGEARKDALFWAETATPVELECYALAALQQLGGDGAPFASRQIKRLVGALWRRMSPDEQSAFKGWINKDDGGVPK